MPSPFVRLHDRKTAKEDDDLQINTNLEQVVTMPTPPPDTTRTSTGSAASSRVSSACTSPDLSKSARTDSYIRGSSLEESPVSSPNGSYVGDVKLAGNYPEVGSPSPSLSKEPCSSSRRSSEEDKCMSDEEAGVQALEQKVPKNIKLPQSK